MIRKNVYNRQVLPVPEDKSLPEVDITYNGNDNISQVIVYTDSSKIFTKKTYNFTYPSGDPVYNGTEYKGMRFNPSTLEFEFSSFISNPNIIGVTIDDNTVLEDAADETVIGNLIAIGGTSPITFSIVTDPDSKFQIGGVDLDELQVDGDAPFTYMTQQSHSVTVRATDVNAKTFDQELTISVSPQTLDDTKCAQVNVAVTNEYFTATGLTSGTLDLTGSFVVSYWMNWPAGQTAFSHITLSTGTSAYKLQLVNDGTGGQTMRLQIIDTGGTLKKDVKFTGITPANSTWHHIMHVYDHSGNTLNCYFDGTVTSKSFFTNNTLTALRSVDEIRVMSRPPGPTSTTQGKIRQLSIWNKAFNEDERIEIYNSGSPSNLKSHSAALSNLKGWWWFNALATGEVIDRVGSVNLTGVNVDSSNFVVI